MVPESPMPFVATPSGGHHHRGQLHPALIQVWFSRAEIYSKRGAKPNFYAADTDAMGRSIVRSRMNNKQAMAPARVSTANPLRAGE